MMPKWTSENWSEKGLAPCEPINTGERTPDCHGCNEVQKEEDEELALRVDVGDEPKEATRMDEFKSLLEQLPRALVGANVSIIESGRSFAESRSRRVGVSVFFRGGGPLVGVATRRHDDALHCVDSRRNERRPLSEVSKCGGSFGEEGFSDR